MIIAIIGLSVTSLATAVGWIISASKAAANLQVKLQSLSDQLEVQTARIAELTEQVKIQNGRVRDIEIKFAHIEGTKK